MLVSFVQSDIFERFLMICVLGNTITLSMEGLTEDEDVNLLRKKLNKWFTIIFIVELLIKLVGMGLKGKLLYSFN